MGFLYVKIKMAKQRYVNTCFRSDPYVENLDPSEKLLFLYFLTNEHTDLCGIYEISIKKISYETWFEKSMVEKVISRFSKDWKVFYHNWYVYVKNFQKHQKTSSPKIKQWIERSMSKIPREVLDFIYSIDTLSIPYPYTITPIPIPIPIPTPIPTPIPILIPMDSKAEISKSISFLIAELKETADSLCIAYVNKDDRKMAKHILTAKEYGTFCEKIWQDRIEFAKNIMIASSKMKYRKWPRWWPADIYRDYADVYNSCKKIQEEQETKHKVVDLSMYNTKNGTNQSV